MSAPTPVVRAVTYERDGHRCVSCASLRFLEYQHRAVEGQGGRKAAPKLDEGVTSCALCNPRYEHDLQRKALLMGWKVRSWVRDRGIAYRVPVFYVFERAWFLLDAEGNRFPISRARARALMDEVYGPEYYEWEAAA